LLTGDAARFRSGHKALPDYFIEDWSSKPDWDAKQSALSRRIFTSVAGTDTLIPPAHFPTPTVGLITVDGDRFNYRFKRD
jgi:hypothetical protein